VAPQKRHEQSVRVARFDTLRGDPFSTEPV